MPGLCSFMHFCFYVCNISIIVALTAASRGTANVCLWVCAVPELRSASSQRTFTADVAAAEYDMNLWRYACSTSQHSMQSIATLPLVLQVVWITHAEMLCLIRHLVFQGAMQVDESQL